MKKMATGVQPWDSAKSKDNSYQLNERVYYKDTETLVEGVYYKSGDTNELSPDRIGQGWTLDVDYVVEWTYLGKYVRGQSKVYYIVGEQIFYYIASPRYFGGSGYPNEEVDLDGIRTWESLQDYDYYPDNVVQSPFLRRDYYQPTFLMPLRKKSGVMFRGDDDWAKTPEIWNFEDFLGGGTTDPVIREIYSTDLYWDSERKYQQYTSVYEANPYSEKTYKFVDDKTNLDGSEIHLKKGIHYTQWLKQTLPPSQKELIPWLSRQLLGGPTMSLHGFSAEIWPAAATDEFELIPVRRQFVNETRRESINFAILHNIAGGNILYGLDSNPSGGTSPFPAETPDADCKGNVTVFYDNHIAFREREIKLIFELYNFTHSWFKNEDGNWDVKINEKPELQSAERQIDTNEASYNGTAWQLPQIEWKQYKKANTRTEIRLIGFKYT